MFITHRPTFLINQINANICWLYRKLVYTVLHRPAVVLQNKHLQTEILPYHGAKPIIIVIKITCAQKLLGVSEPKSNGAPVKPNNGNVKTVQFCYHFWGISLVSVLQIDCIGLSLTLIYGFISGTKYFIRAAVLLKGKHYFSVGSSWPQMNRL